MHMCLCLSVSDYLFWVVLLSVQRQCECLKVVLVCLEIDLFVLWLSFGRGWHKPVIDLLCTKIRFELDRVLLQGSVRITQTDCEGFKSSRRAFELTPSASIK